MRRLLQCTSEVCPHLMWDEWERDQVTREVHSTIRKLILAILFFPAEEE